MKRFALVAVVFAAACGDNGAAPCGGDGQAHVCDGTLVGSDGRALVLRGVNFAGSHKMSPYTDPFGPADFMRLRAWGFQVVRYVVPWAALEPSPGSYDDAYLDGIAMRAEWAQQAGIQVVVDLHQDVFGEGFGFDGAPAWACDAARYAAFKPMAEWQLDYTDPNVEACFDNFYDPTSDADARFVAMWSHVAERLASEPAVLGFDPLNEPSWGSYNISTFERDRLQPFYDRVIAAVRAKAPQWIVFAEPSGSRNLGVATSLQPFSEPDVVYAPHLYDGPAESTGMFQPSDRDDVLANAAALRSEASRLGTALWIGEYGGQGTDPGIGAYMAADYDGAAAGSAGTAYWAFGDGGGYDLLDPDGSEVAPLLDAVVVPAPSRVAGALTAWSDDRDAHALTVGWTPDPSGLATVVLAPARAFPNGAAVACAACSKVSIDGDEISLSAPAGVAATATITAK